MNLLQTLLFGLSVCVDCFAVSLCSSVKLKDNSAGKTLKIALCFAVIQTSFLLAGWGFGDILAMFIEKIAKWIGLALLLYVGGQMIYSAFFCHGESESHDLNGIKNILIAGIATSIDALAIGSSLSLTGQNWHDTLPQAISVFVFTALSVALGIAGGKKIAHKAGHWAEGIGGIVLIGIGFGLVL